MARAGECPACASKFDAATHIPMVSVVCGHSLCFNCVNPSPPSPSPRPDDAASISTSSSDAEDDLVHQPASRCPVCNTALAGFVKNFEALSTLESVMEPAPPTDVPDLTSVVHGDLVISRDQIHFTRSPAHELGAGASAIVYRGMYAGLPVAVKCIRTMSDSWATEDRLRRELRNASRLRNPHIVEFRGAAWDHEAGPSSPRNVLLVTELMAGGNLRESLTTLTDETGLSLDSFVTIGLQITRGIEYLHAEGLAHRDIKSANILLSERLQRNKTSFSSAIRAKIADFGLSKYIDKATGGGTVMQSIMEPGRLEATYAYLAPEAFGGDKSNAIHRDESDDDDARYDEMAKKRDIYALGVLFWEMLTGAVPWGGVSLPDVYVRVCVRSDRPGPALDDAKVSKSVRRLVERCWAQNPSRRPSAKSIAAKLEKIAVKIGLTETNNSAAAAAAAEAVSVVSGQTPNAASLKNSVPDVHSEPLQDITEQREMEPHVVSDSLMAYQKMPSASTLYTVNNEGAKTHSTGFEPSDGRDLDGMDEAYDDAVWIDDNEPGTGRSHSQRHANSVNHASEPGDISLPRRQLRGRHQTGEGPDPGHSRSHPNVSTNHVSASPVTSANASGGASGTQVKSTPTAVAATAAAIAAAKDRERKRDDVRSRGITSRVTRAVTPSNVMGPAVGDTSFHSLPSAGEGWQRSAAKERSEQQRAMFYDNSDEEAQDFDPERAAAEEAIAESGGTAVISQTTLQPPRHTNSINRNPQQAQRSVSINRIAARPQSPAVRRPMSPMTVPASRPMSPAVVPSKSGNTEDEGTKAGPSSGPRTSDAAPAKRNSGNSRGRLSRTMSASVPSNTVINRSHGAAANSAVSAAAPQSVPTLPQEGSGKRAFIRRMRSNESPRRLARSSSTTGVESKRPKGPPNKSPSHASDTVVSEEDDAEYTVVQIGSSPKEDFSATVESLDKTGLMRLLSQRMIPLRLAALAHAALVSPKHQNEEEVLRNACAILHRLTVPSNSPQSKNNVQEISAKEQLSIRKYLKASQGVQALLEALSPPGIRHPTTLSYAMLALGNLTAWDLEAHKQFRSAHGVIQVTKVMKTHVQNSGVQEKGCYALACVGAAYPAKSKTIFEQAGALDVVNMALSHVQRESPNDAVTKQACAALGAMCSSCPSNALYAGKKEALTYLVTAFERFRRASRVEGGKRSEMRLVCKAFIDLLCHDDNRKLAGSKGGSTMIIRAMRIFRLDADFIEKGLTTLSEFCIYRSNGTQIVQANGVDDIVAAMVRFRMNISMQEEGSRVLTLLMKATGDQARRRLVHAGGAEAIVYALERFGAIPDSNAAIVVETCRALNMLFQMENGAEGEILGRRMKKIRCDKAIKAALVAHRSNSSIQDKGKEALKQLTLLKGGGGIWSRMRNGQKRR